MRSNLTAAFGYLMSHELLDLHPCASGPVIRYQADTRARAGSLRRWRPGYGPLLALFLATVAAPALAAASDTDQEKGLEEVIVTAEKKAERLQDVPIPVTAIDASTLVDNNEVKLQDFYTAFPGLDINFAQQSAVNLLVRGLPASITIDDVPLSIASYLEEAGGLAFDLDPSGLSQVELLRGPQGTLYGADSEGGLLRYVTADPRTDSVSGHWDAGVNSVYNGAEPGWNFRGSVNVPLGSDVALRMDGFARQDPGYIDNPILGIDGVNLSHTYGGHLALLWTPSDALSLKLGAFLQESRGDGTNDVDLAPGLGLYDQNYIAGAGPFYRLSQLYNGTLNYKFGPFQLTSVTGYVWTGFHDSLDATSGGLVPYAQFGIPGTSFTGFGQPGLLQPEDAHSSQFSQEVRLTTQIGKFMDVLFGGFYNYAYGVYGQNLLSTNPLTGEVAGNFSFIGFGSAARYYAAFTNLTFHLTDQFQLQLGGRQEWDHFYSYGTAFSGPANPIFGISTPALTVLPSPPGLSQKFTFLVTPQYKLSPDLMVYARVASGYEPGTPNPVEAGIPPESQADTVINYELGAKAELLDHKWSFDTSVYYIEHTNIQTGLFSQQANIFYFGNSGSAKIEGLELSTQVRPVTGLTVGGWVSWAESKLTDIPATSELASYEGQALPFFPRFSGNLSIDQQFPVATSITGFAGAAITYIGSRLDNFIGGGEDRLVFPAYAKTDLHIGMNYGDWMARLYANNVTNRRGIINGGPATLIPDSYYYITPRVIGLQVSKKF
jgi:iron complex outermembrane recepter protein